MVYSCPWFHIGLYCLPCGCLRHTFTTRLVYSVILSECYAPGGATIDPLLRRLVQDLNQLEQEGLEAKYPKPSFNIFSPPNQDRICLGILVNSTVVANSKLCRCYWATAKSKYIANIWETKGIGLGCEPLTNWRLATTANVFVTFVKLQMLGCN